MASSLGFHVEAAGSLSFDTYDDIDRRTGFSPFPYASADTDGRTVAKSMEGGYTAMPGPLCRSAPGSTCAMSACHRASALRQGQLRPDGLWQPQCAGHGRRLSATLASAVTATVAYEGEFQEVDGQEHAPSARVRIGF